VCCTNLRRRRILDLPRVGPFLLVSGIFLCASPAPAQSTNNASANPPSNLISAPHVQEAQPEIRRGCSIKASTSAAAIAENPSLYVPVSTRCKLDLFVRQTYSPYTFASAAFDATWGQMMAQWPQYGGGMQGWGKRLGATLADTESRRFIQGFVLSSAFHQDPRYFPSGKKPLVARAWYAASRVLVTKGDQGQSEVNSSEVFGALFTSSLQNLYYPVEYRTFGGTMNRFFGALSSDATSDILHEFTPDMKRLFHKHAPKRIQQLEQKVPLPAEDRW
jgi:hypothetical protein